MPPSLLRPTALTAKDVASASTLDDRLSLRYSERIAQQFFTHSAHAPLTILILEWLLSPDGYFREIDAYVLLAAALTQAAWQAHSRTRTTLGVIAGNLLGVALYSVIESLVEGLRFFQSEQHLAYWIIAVSFAILQGMRQASSRVSFQESLLLAENIFRAGIPVLLYAVFEARSKQTFLDFSGFFGDPAHLYLTIVVLLLGVLLGFADLTLNRTQAVVRQLTERLHQLSTWGFGERVVAEALNDSSSFALRRQTRSILFLDLRGFTAWSEAQTAEAVVDMLDRFYAAGEAALLTFGPIKIKYTADEIMAVFGDASAAIAAARLLQTNIASELASEGLLAGIGVHSGPVVEGLLGSHGVKAYEVIGDTVNTASRVCSAAGPGELLISADALPDGKVAIADSREIVMKGKRKPLLVYVERNR